MEVRCSLISLQQQIKSTRQRKKHVHKNKLHIISSCKRRHIVTSSSHRHITHHKILAARSTTKVNNYDPIIKLSLSDSYQKNHNIAHRFGRIPWFWNTCSLRGKFSRKSCYYKKVCMLAPTTSDTNFSDSCCLFLF